MLDTILDRSVVLGYGNTGSEVRRRLSGWPADPPRMDGRTILVTGAASAIARLGAPVWALSWTMQRHHFRHPARFLIRRPRDRER